ncbi:Aldo/keto reductase [Peniophora sp. CONT]|nr:Aldo/keto reductase [Peniophora sp. CONT]
MLSLNHKVKLRSGYEMPRLGYGVGMNRNTLPTVLEAFKAGYRHIDSAKMYGNEAECGEAIRTSGLPRSEIFYTTKIFDPDHGYTSTLAAVDRSLSFANLDYIDLFLIHTPRSSKTQRLETYRALLEKRDAGLIKSVGVSNYGIRHLEEIAAAGLEMPVVNQIEVHPWCQQREIRAYCESEGIVVQAYCPLVRNRPELIGDPVLVRIAEKHKREPVRVLLRWSLQHGLVPLPKTETPKRIWSNAALYDFELDADDMAALDGLDRGADGAISWNPIDVP